MSAWKPWFAWHPVWVEEQHVWGRWVERALFDGYHTGPQWRYRPYQPVGTQRRAGGAGRLIG
jgi:hypothetical protein